MARYSLHIGVNETDRALYPEPFEYLTACVNDAYAMRELAQEQGFAAELLEDSQATAAAVNSGLESLADRLNSSDLLFLTYSGHGSQGPDTNQDERGDGLDETWALYDRQLLDDELWFAWSRFKPGVNILLVSDSCNSGGVARISPLTAAVSSGRALAGARSRRLPPEARRSDMTGRSGLYAGVKDGLPSPDGVSVNATVLLIAACQEGEDASEVGDHGVLTSAFLETWDHGEFRGSHLEFFQLLRDRVAGQTPNYLPLGRENLDFENRQPLTA